MLLEALRLLTPRVVDALAKDALEAHEVARVVEVLEPALMRFFSLKGAYSQHIMGVCTDYAPAICWCSVRTLSQPRRAPRYVGRQRACWWAAGKVELGDCRVLLGLPRFGSVVVRACFGLTVRGGRLVLLALARRKRDEGLVGERGGLRQGGHVSRVMERGRERWEMREEELHKCHGGASMVRWSARGRGS